MSFQIEKLCLWKNVHRHPTMLQFRDLFSPTTQWVTTHCSSAWYVVRSCELNKSIKITLSLRTGKISPLFMTVMLSMIVMGNPAQIPSIYGLWQPDMELSPRLSPGSSVQSPLIPLWLQVDWKGDLRIRSLSPSPLIFVFPTPWVNDSQIAICSHQMTYSKCRLSIE